MPGELKEGRLKTIGEDGTNKSGTKKQEKQKNKEKKRLFKIQPSHSKGCGHELQYSRACMFMCA